MAIINDISNWSESLYDYSLELITYEGIFKFSSEEKLVKYSENVDQIRKSWIREKDPAMHAFWLTFCVGIECLCKAVLVKHKCLKITKRNILNKYPIKKKFYSLEEAEEYREDLHGSVYRTAARKVRASRNNWLKKKLDEKNIDYTFEINTPTLGYIYNHSFNKLFKRNLIDEEEKESLEKGIETLTDIRRNVDAHTFLSRRTVGSIQKDIEKIYLPNINLLLKIYERSP